MNTLLDNVLASIRRIDDISTKTESTAYTATRYGFKDVATKLTQDLMHEEL